jgi:hypothetical protein
MFEVVTVTTYTWPNDGIPFAGLRIRVEELAARLGVAVHTWDIDGLGPAKGFGFRTASGRVYLLQELALAVQYHGATGPSLYVDAADLSTVGPAALADEVFATLGLAHSDVLFFADAAAVKRAAELVAKVTAAKTKRDV